MFQQRSNSSNSKDSVAPLTRIPAEFTKTSNAVIKVDINGSKVKIKTLKFRPYVMAGRVFKEEESLTLWVSADENKIPLKIKADLAVGSLRADLVEYKGLKHYFPIQFD